MEFLDHVAEQRIQAALGRGELESLPGAGRPLEFDDNSLIPAHLRMACRILKNAGMLPPEIETLRELHQLYARIDADGSEPALHDARCRLQFLHYKLERAGFTVTSRAVMAQYQDRLLARLQRI
jgi:hypothetical protein